MIVLKALAAALTIPIVGIAGYFITYALFASLQWVGKRGLWWLVAYGTFLFFVLFLAAGLLA